MNRLSLVALAALLSGCASLQQPAAPSAALAVPAHWQRSAAAADPTALAQWWDRFGDPLLSRLVAQALMQGTDLQAAQARLQQARALRDQAAAALAPTLVGSASAQGARRESAPNTRSVGAGFDARWEPDLSGGGRSGLSAADANLAAQRAAFGGTAVSVAAEVAAAYIDLRAAQARLAIAADNLASQLQTLQITDWRAQAGLVTELDILQARTAAEQTRAQLPALRSAIDQSMHALAVLTGVVPGTLNTELSAAAAMPAAPADLALAIPAEVLRQRPDVSAAEQQLLAADARVQQADAARLPSLSLGGSVGLSALNVGALGSGAGVASLLATVYVPLFDGGRIRAQVRQQEGVRDEAFASYRSTLLTALQDVEDSLVALRGVREQLASQQAAANAARAAATLAGQRYESGLVDFQNVLLSQRTQFAAEDAVASTRAAVNAQHVRLYKALGGGWTPLEEAQATR